MQQVVIVPTELKLQRNTTGAYITINIEVFIEVVVVLPRPSRFATRKVAEAPRTVRGGTITSAWFISFHHIPCA
jgi:hypothetical protein